MAAIGQVEVAVIRRCGTPNLSAKTEVFATVVEQVPTRRTVCMSTLFRQLSS